MNNYKLGYGLGEKTTIWSNGVASLLDKDLDGLTVWGVNPLFTYQSNNVTLSLQMFRANRAKQLVVMPKEYIETVYDEMGYGYGGFPHPSAGMLTIRCALESFPLHDIELFNFSFFKDSEDGTNNNHHYWEEDDSFDKMHTYVAKAHDGNREREYVKGLMDKNKRLTWMK